MIRLQDILRESAIMDRIEVSPVGEVSCKWDTGNTTQASALHAHDIVVDGDTVTWRHRGQQHSAPITGYSKPRGKATRPIITTHVTWQGKRIKVPVALVDRSANTAEFLCNMDLMQRLGIQIDTITKRAYTK